MKAIAIAGTNNVAFTDVPQPENAAPGHLIIKMQAMGINPGDITFLSGSMAPGFFPESKYGIKGVSGVGKVIETGEGVPAYYLGKMVTVYRSLIFSDQLVGTWSEYAQLHYLQCAILPDNVNANAYAGSLVNIITPYAFLKQIQEEGHKGIINTAGNSATGIAMIGIGEAFNVPVISIVRNAKGKEELKALGAKHIVVQDETGFKDQLKELSAQLSTTAVFDGVGGSILTEIIDLIPNGSTIYAYGFLGGQAPLSFHTRILMKGISLRGFGNFRTETVQNHQKLEAALTHISSMLLMPHFTTKIGQEFTLEQIEEALAYKSANGGKAILRVG